MLLALPAALAGVVRIERVSVGITGEPAGGRGSPSISADGRFVAFASGAGNLVPGDTNDRSDVFVRDRQSGKTEIVSVAVDGAPGNASSDSPAISADGRSIAFPSDATNLVPGDTNGRTDVFVAERQ